MCTADPCGHAVTQLSAPVAGESTVVLVRAGGTQE